jgi:hypothetical protein
MCMCVAFHCSKMPYQCNTDFFITLQVCLLDIDHEYKNTTFYCQSMANAFLLRICLLKDLVIKNIVFVKSARAM